MRIRAGFALVGCVGKRAMLFWKRAFLRFYDSPHGCVCLSIFFFGIMTTFGWPLILACVYQNILFHARASLWHVFFSSGKRATTKMLLVLVFLRAFFCAFVNDSWRGFTTTRALRPSQLANSFYWLRLICKFFCEAKRFFYCWHVSNEFCGVLNGKPWERIAGAAQQMELQKYINRHLLCGVMISGELFAVMLSILLSGCKHFMRGPRDFFFVFGNWP